MKRFRTLLLREWMQHRRGWLVLMAAPIVVLAVIALFGSMHIEVDDVEVGPDAPGPLVLAFAAVGGLGAVSLLLAWAASLLQAPGLARRDVQDRSIEFWLSLPTPHAASIGATLLMHLLLFPWLALAVGLGGGLLLSLPLVAKGFGVGAWLALPWATIVAAGVAMALRLMLGVLLATLWLSPLILGTMAASAWLKRWGVPVVVGSLLVGGGILEKVYGNPVVFRVLRYLGTQAAQAFLVADRSEAMRLRIEDAEQLDGFLRVLPSWAVGDAVSALAALATPGFVAALLAGAAAFALLWLRRRRGA